jgi:hypothetical protein
MRINPDYLEQWILENWAGLVATNAYRERSFFYNPAGLLPKGVYFATIKESDGPNDKASELDREGVFRLSTGVGSATYEAMFGPKPKRPAKGGVVALTADFVNLDQLHPHPVYAWLGWVAINNPSPASLPMVQELLETSYRLVKVKYDKNGRTRTF